MNYYSSREMYMSQTSMSFGEENLILRDGEVTYYPNFFSKDYFSRLFQEVDWQEDQITIFGRTHNIPRLQAWYADEGLEYSYSGIQLKHHKWSQLLLEIKSMVEQHTKLQFNGCLINLYRNGSDYVSWHSDDEDELGVHPNIASVSFGESRVLSFRHKISRELVKCTVEDNSLVLMRAPLQKFWEHQINKTAKDIGPRINLTFRRLI